VAVVAAMGGIDVLAFSGGIGEHVPGIRALAVERLSFLGVSLDPDANRGARGGDADLSRPGAPVRTVVVAAREDLVIAEPVRQVLGG
jgi:acetate kinase